MACAVAPITVQLSILATAPALFRVKMIRVLFPIGNVSTTVAPGFARHGTHCVQVVNIRFGTSLRFQRGIGLRAIAAQGARFPHGLGICQAKHVRGTGVPLVNDSAPVDRLRIGAAPPGAIEATIARAIVAMFAMAMIGFFVLVDGPIAAITPKDGEPDWVFLTQRPD